MFPSLLPQLHRIYLSAEAEDLYRYTTSSSRTCSRIPIRNESGDDGAMKLSNLIPIGLSPQNIGSNIGLAELLLDAVEPDVPDGSPNKFRIICADIDIYTRSLRVIIYIQSSQSH